MRDIKFRCWDKKNKTISKPFTLGWALKCEDGYILEKCLPMQYTGLKDKNGKEIYEGDIVKITFRDGLSEIGEMIYETDGTGFVWKRFREWYRLSQQNDFEVIGTIYENPELIKKEPHDDNKI